MFVERQLPRLALAKAHQDCVDCNPVEPGRKGGVAAERVQATENLNEGILRQVLGQRSITRHEQTKGVNAPLVLFEQGRKCLLVSLSSADNKPNIGRQTHAS
jgi:hypothetical protein